MKPETDHGPLRVRLADPGDAHDLAPRLRPWDIVECLVVGQDPLTALTGPFWKENGPYTRAFEVEGRVVGMGGATPSPDGAARIWFLGAPEIERPDLVLPMFAAARSLTAAALEEFSPLVNAVPAGHKRALRWIERLGFDIDPDIVHVRGIAFLRFRKTR